MPDIRLQTYTRWIAKLIQDNRQGTAIAHCQHILRHYPNFVQGYRLLGEACQAKGLEQEAADCLQRVLGADPECLVTWVGLAKAYEKLGMGSEATWSMERAFELAPANAEVRLELHRLSAYRDESQGTTEERRRPRLTRAALGRLYARGGLYELAISELKAVLRREPNLPHIRVSLAEALWHEGRHLEAVETCQEILEALPNCLKANLILGEIWLRDGREEAGQAKLKITGALDPEHTVAQQMMGRASPLPPQEVFVPLLEEEAIAPLTLETRAEKQDREEGLPDWVRELGVLESQADAAGEAG
jgi:tetratricopeptide (TPR) repeat protein